MIILSGLFLRRREIAGICWIAKAQVPFNCIRKVWNPQHELNTLLPNSELGHTDHRTLRKKIRILLQCLIYNTPWDTLLVPLSAKLEWYNFPQRGTSWTTAQKHILHILRQLFGLSGSDYTVRRVSAICTLLTSVTQWYIFFDLSRISNLL